MCKLEFNNLVIPKVWESWYDSAIQCHQISVQTDSKQKNEQETQLI